MRVVNRKLELIINCDCGLKLAYVFDEVGQRCKCPKCGKQHDLDGTHDTVMLENVKVSYPPPKKLVEHSRKNLEVF